MLNSDHIVINLKSILKELPQGVILVAVSKTIPLSGIMKAYDAGQRDFGENRVQELLSKQSRLPTDIRWHLVGHLQSNKVKHIASFIHLVHSVDNPELLKEINKEGEKHRRVIPCLLQVRIAREETKHGMGLEEVKMLLSQDSGQETEKHPFVSIDGLMGMATFTSDKHIIRNEFRTLGIFFEKMRMCNKRLKILSMGMSGDYRIALEEGSNMVRIGSGIFRNTDYTD